MFKIVFDSACDLKIANALKSAIIADTLLHCGEIDRFVVYRAELADLKKLFSRVKELELAFSASGMFPSESDNYSFTQGVFHAEIACSRLDAADIVGLNVSEIIYSGRLSSFEPV